MIKADTTMTLDYFNDVYFLEAIKTKLSSKYMEQPDLRFNHTLNKLENDINEYENLLFPNLAHRTFLYIYAACLGEARHAKGDHARSYFIPEILKKERGDLFAEITEYAPTANNLNALIDIFKQDWNGSFGGKPWMDIAKACKMYFEVPPSVFLDHVVDLQHNGGTVFSKSESETTMNFKLHYKGSFHGFLDYKFKRDILKDQPSFYMWVTRPTRKFLNRYEAIFHTQEIHWAIARLRNLTETLVEWGDKSLSMVKKWLEWSYCKNGNHPDPEYLLNKAGAYDISYMRHTKKEYKAELHRAEHKAIDLLKGQFSELYPQVHKTTLKIYKENVKHCKLQKAKKTYWSVPCALKCDHKGNMILQIPVKYYGYGIETEWGFEIHTQTDITEKGTEKGYDGTDGFSYGIITCKHGYTYIYTYNYSWSYNDKHLEVILT